MDLSVSTNKKGESYNSILIIIDYLTKIIYYTYVKVRTDILSLAKVIINVVVRHHDIPKSIITD